MTTCEKNWQLKCGTFNGKCKTVNVPGCWQGFDTYRKGVGKCGCTKLKNKYVRRTGTSYNSIMNSGPLGHPKANSFDPVLFETNVPVWMWLDQATRRNKGNKYCKNRCKGQRRLKGRTPRTTSTPGSNTSSRNVAPPLQSYETILAIRKAKAYYEPANYKKNRKWKRANCKY